MPGTPPRELPLPRYVREDPAVRTPVGFPDYRSTGLRAPPRTPGDLRPRPPAGAPPPPPRPEHPAARPPGGFPCYRSTGLRAPLRTPVDLPHRLTEVTGPVLGEDRVRPTGAARTRREGGGGQ